MTTQADSFKMERADTGLLPHAVPNHNPTFRGGAAMADHQIIINGEVFKLIPLGFCACGCGGKTRSGLNKHGVPFKFIHGHNGAKEFNWQWKNGRAKETGRYVKILKPSHPRANSKGYVYEHILICEKALGKLLPQNAEPHHFDGNKANNENKNLILCQDREYHFLLEQRTRAFRACGNPSWRKCWICKKYDSPEKLFIREHGPSYHRTCKKEYKRKIKQRRLESEGIRCG